MTRWTVDGIKRWLRTVPNSGPVYAPFQPPPYARFAADNQLLCQALCASYRALERTKSRSTRMHIVEERGAYLDALERRNPEAFAAWLVSGAGPTDNPLPYLNHVHIDREAIDWDDLVGGQDLS
jgi:hypothetical protein